jgi:hypothetical protein
VGSVFTPTCTNFGVKLDPDSGPDLQWGYDNIRGNALVLLVRAPASQDAIERIIRAPAERKSAESKAAAAALVPVEGRARAGVAGLLGFAAQRRAVRRARAVELASAGQAGEYGEEWVRAGADADVIACGALTVWGCHLARRGEEINGDTQSVWVQDRPDGEELVTVTDAVLVKRRPRYSDFTDPEGGYGSLDILRRVLDRTCAAPQCSKPVPEDQYRHQARRKRSASRVICCEGHQLCQQGKYEERCRERIRDLLEDVVFPAMAVCQCERRDVGEFGLCTMCERPVLARLPHDHGRT